MNVSDAILDSLRTDQLIHRLGLRINELHERLAVCRDEEVPQLQAEFEHVGLLHLLLTEFPRGRQPTGATRQAGAVRAEPPASGGDGAVREHAVHLL